MAQRYILQLAVIVLLVSSVASSQVTVSLGSANLHTGKIGLGVDGITGSPNLLLKYFFNNRLAAQLIAGFSIDSPGGSAPAGTTEVTGIAIRGGASILFHLTQDQVSPYVGVEGLYQTTKPAGFYTVEPGRRNSVAGGAVFGAEYFIIERFSVGIKQRLGFDLQLDAPEDLHFDTSTLMTGRYYFN